MQHHRNLRNVLSFNFHQFATRLHFNYFLFHSLQVHEQRDLMKTERKQDYRISQATQIATGNNFGKFVMRRKYLRDELLPAAKVKRENRKEKIIIEIFICFRCFFGYCGAFLINMLVEWHTFFIEFKRNRSFKCQFFIFLRDVCYVWQMIIPDQQLHRCALQSKLSMSPWFQNIEAVKLLFQKRQNHRNCLNFK